MEHAPHPNVERAAELAQELSENYGLESFKTCRTMGELVIEHLSILERPHAGL